MAEGVVEVNFDGLVGPTHHYAGLAFGNEASMKHRDAPSNPQRAAWQGLEKAWTVAQLGIPQAVLPPQDRPNMRWLRELGFSGTDAEILAQAARQEPRLLSAAYSASSMWAANAATVSPSLDTIDRKVHLTPANLNSGLHRSLEAAETTRMLRRVFAQDRFVVHDPLPAAVGLRDEGAANHTRLTASSTHSGLHLFVYGQDTLHHEQSATHRYPARQTRLASEAIARRHGLAPKQCLFVAQHPSAIDAGVFHNDVISVGHENLLLMHRLAFADQERVLEDLQTRFAALKSTSLEIIVFEPDELPLNDAVSSYLFNSQIVTTDEGHRVILCPTDCQQNPAAAACLEKIIGPQQAIQQVMFVDLRQSMDNGGGPACLRLRVPLTVDEQAAVHPGVWLDDRMYHRLRDVISAHYRTTLTFGDLTEPRFQRECQTARQAILEAMNLDLS